MSQHVSRREFLGRSAAAGAALAGVGYWSSLSAAVSKSPNEKLNIALFGVGKGHSDAQGCASENIAVVCDVDEARARHSLREFKGAKYAKDYRKVLEDRSLDAVIVATPDHTHAVIGIMAMKLGLHCFCQKPLTRTIEEARLMARVANEMKVATQMGNQGISADGFRAAVDTIRGGRLGEVRQVHCWTDRPLISVGWRQGLGRPEGAPPVPPTLDWDVWLGPAP
jgi:predicted dehydrogenase